MIGFYTVQNVGKSFLSVVLSQ